jgi:hypothetical protein
MLSGRLFVVGVFFFVSRLLPRRPDASRRSRPPGLRLRRLQVRVLPRRRHPSTRSSSRVSYIFDNSKEPHFKYSIYHAHVFCLKSAEVSEAERGRPFAGCGEQPGQVKKEWVDQKRATQSLLLLQACHLQKDAGHCRENFTVKWFFDKNYGGCSRQGTRIGPLWLVTA